MHPFCSRFSGTDCLARRRRARLPDLAGSSSRNGGSVSTGHWACYFGTFRRLRLDPDFGIEDRGTRSDGPRRLILVAFLTLIYRLAARRFRIHARGLARRRLLWTAELTDDEITGLSYSAVRYYTNGAYKGLLFAIRADPDRSTGKRAVEFRRYSDRLRKRSWTSFGIGSRCGWRRR